MKHVKIPSFQRGYSLIELLVVITILSLIGVTGIASFVTYNNSQIVESAAADVANFYTLARQHTLSQIKPPQCTSTQSLRGYSVTISAAAGTYRINGLCGNSSILISSKTLPRDVVFAGTSPSTVQFNVPNADTATQATVTINGYGKTKTITINTSGTISAD